MQMSVWDLIHDALPKFDDGRPQPVVSFTDTTGYPFSLRCIAAETELGGHRCFKLTLPAGVIVPAGPGWLLWHRHDKQLGRMTAFALSGRLAETAYGLAFTPRKVSGRVGLGDSDSPDARSIMIGEAETYLRQNNLPEPKMNWKLFEDLAEQAEQ
jgi:hypothetical protein